MSAKYSMSEEANKELMNELRKNILESVNVVCEQYKVVSMINLKFSQ